MGTRIKDWIKTHKASSAFCLIIATFIALCGLFVRFEMTWFPYIVFVFIGLYLVCFRTEASLYLTALLIPFSINVSEKIPSVAFNMSVPSEPLLILLMLLFVWRIIREKRYPSALARHPISICLYVYLAWMFVTALNSTMPLVSFKFLLSKLWFILPCYFFLAELVFRQERNALKFLMCYALGLGIVVCITTVKHMHLGDVRKVAYWVMSPYYNDHTAYGAVLAFFSCLLPGFLCMKSEKKSIRRLSAVLLALVLTGLYLSYSRAAWLSLVIAIAVYVLMRLRIRFRTVAIVSIIGAALILTFADDVMYKLNKNDTESSKNLVEHLQSMTNISSDASNVERINRWTSAIAMFKQKPLLGWGPGTYQFQYAPFQYSKYRTIITTDAGDGGNAHSEYLGLLSEEGIPGTLILCILIACCLATGMKLYHRSEGQSFRRLLCCVCVLALISYFTHGFMNNFLDTEKLAAPVFGVMGILAAEDARSKTEKQEAKP